MATASIPVPSATRKRTPPSPQRVYETWQHECRSAGEWGAYARTAARYHKPSGEPYSDEWARKLCKRWEAEQHAREAAEAAPVDDTLAYMPPPGGYPQPQPAAVLRQPNSPTSTLRTPTIGGDLPTSERAAYVAVNGNVLLSQLANPANRQLFELETRWAEDANRQPDSAERPEQPQRQGEPYDGTYGSGEMEPKHGGIPRSPSGYDQLEERPAREIPEERPQPSGIPRSPSGGEQPEEQPRQTSGIVRDYLKHSRATVERDGLLVLGWRWMEEHPLIGPLPSRAIVVLLAGLVLAVLFG